MKMIFDFEFFQLEFFSQLRGIKTDFFQFDILFFACPKCPCYRQQSKHLIFRQLLYVWCSCRGMNLAMNLSHLVKQYPTSSLRFCKIPCIQEKIQCVSYVAINRGGCCKS